MPLSSEQRNALVGELELWFFEQQRARHPLVSTPEFRGSEDAQSCQVYWQDAISGPVLHHISLVAGQTATSYAKRSANIFASLAEFMDENREAILHVLNGEDPTPPHNHFINPPHGGAALSDADIAAVAAQLDALTQQAFRQALFDEEEKFEAGYRELVARTGHIFLRYEELMQEMHAKLKADPHFDYKIHRQKVVAEYADKIEGLRELISSLYDMDISDFPDSLSWAREDMYQLLTKVDESAFKALKNYRNPPHKNLSDEEFEDLAKPFDDMLEAALKRIGYTDERNQKLGIFVDDVLFIQRKIKIVVAEMAEKLSDRRLFETPFPMNERLGDLFRSRMLNAYQKQLDELCDELQAHVDDPDHASYFIADPGEAALPFRRTQLKQHIDDLRQGCHQMIGDFKQMPRGELEERMEEALAHARVPQKAVVDAMVDAQEQGAVAYSDANGSYEEARRVFDLQREHIADAVQSQLASDKHRDRLHNALVDMELHRAAANAAAEQQRLADLQEALTPSIHAGIQEACDDDLEIWSQTYKHARERADEMDEAFAAKARLQTAEEFLPEYQTTALAALHAANVELPGRMRDNIDFKNGVRTYKAEAVNPKTNQRVKTPVAQLKFTEAEKRDPAKRYAKMMAFVRIYKDLLQEEGVEPLIMSPAAAGRNNPPVSLGDWLSMGCGAACFGGISPFGKVAHQISRQQGDSVYAQDYMSELLGVMHAHGMSNAKLAGHVSTPAREAKFKAARGFALATRHEQANLGLEKIAEDHGDRTGTDPKDVLDDLHRLGRFNRPISVK